jgi:hypothetical protein
MDNMLVRKVRLTVLDVWGLPVLAILLLALGVIEYPFALYKQGIYRVIDVGSYSREILIMLMPSIAAFWLGWKSKWPELGDIPPHYWLILAFALALLPPAFHMSYGNRPAWRMEFWGFIIHVDAGLVSSIAFLAWIASLRVGVKNVGSSFDTWMSKYYSAPLLIAAWLWLVSSVDDYFLMAALVVFPIAILLLRGTFWFDSCAEMAFYFVGGGIYAIWASPYRKMVFERNFMPYDDPFGYHFAARKIQHVYEASSFLGGDTGIYYPRAIDQYKLVSIMEHLGWIGMGAVVLSIVLFFIVSFRRLNNQPISWRKEFSLCLWGFLVLGFGFNLLATATLTIRPGIGAPFVSHEFFIAAIAAFITGVSMRGVAQTSRRRSHLSLVVCNANAVSKPEGRGIWRET